MANIHANIAPGRLDQRDEVDALYMCFRALQVLCQKLDLDGGVPLTTYEANVITALVNLSITDSKGNRFSNAAANTSSLEEHVVINPVGITDEGRIAAGCQFWNALETLAEQLDTDTLTFSNYEAKGFTAVCKHAWVNRFGTTYGRGTAFYFGPTAIGDHRHYIDDLFDRFKAIHAICYGDAATYGLDTDGTVTDTTYTALIYTAILTMMIEDSMANQIGISR